MHLVTVIVDKTSLLGEKRFKSFEEATHSKSISESDTSVHSSTSQTKQLPYRVAQLFYTINYLPVLLKKKKRRECA